MNIKSALYAGESLLRESGIDESFLNAELLLQQATGKSRSEIILSFETELSEQEEAKYFDLLTTRITRKPLQYITGIAEFYGRKFFVTQDVLIPRPETELIIDLVKSFSSGTQNYSVLDVGTGSGNIAITLKKELLNVKVVATDISFSAILNARWNARFHEIYSGIYFLCADVFSSLKLSNKFHIIVSNPPYVPSHRIKDLEPEVKDFEPLIAINGGEDGLTIIKKIVSGAGNYLLPGGKLVIEIDSFQTNAVISMAEEAGTYSELLVQKDLAGLDRIFIATRK